MAWEIDIPDVVGNNAILTTWGNPVRDRLVHPIGLFGDLPTSGIVDGAVAYVGDRDKFYGRVNNLWKEFASQDVPLTVGAPIGDKTAGAVFQNADGSQFIQIASNRRIQAYSAGAAAELFLNPSGGAVSVGVMKLDPAAFKLFFGTDDSINFNEAANRYDFVADNAKANIDVAGITASAAISGASLSVTGTLAGAAITGTSLNIGGGTVTAGAINGSIITASTQFKTGNTTFDDGLIARTAGGGLSLHCTGNDIVLGVGNARTLFVKNNLTGADLMTLQLSGARVAARYPSGLPELGGMADVGIVTSSWQLGIPTSKIEHKTQIGAVGPSRVWDINPVKFTWLPEYGGYEDEGFLAEELAMIDTRLVARYTDGTVYGINRNALLAEIVAALHELKELINGRDNNERQDDRVFSREHQLQFRF